MTPKRSRGPGSGVALSKAVLEMKFMKRTKDRLRLEAAEADRAALVCAPEELLGGVPRAPVEPSLGACFELIDGRVSFGGFNANLEALIRKETAPPETSEPDKEITDAELAAAFDPKARRREKGGKTSFNNLSNKPKGSMSKQRKNHQ